MVVASVAVRVRPKEGADRPRPLEQRHLRPQRLRHPLGRLSGGGGQGHDQAVAFGRSRQMGQGQQPGNGAGLARPRSSGDDRDPGRERPAGGQPLQVGLGTVVGAEQAVEGFLHHELGQRVRGWPLPLRAGRARRVRSLATAFSSRQ